jgi:hypothetical protein
MAAFESVWRAELAACADAALGDPLLAELAKRADTYEKRGDIPLVLNLSDGSRISGILSSDIEMAKACDAPLEQFWATLELRPDASPEARELFEKFQPTLGGRRLSTWRTALHDRVAEASRRAAGDRDTYVLEDASDSDLLVLASYAKRGALTLRDAQVRQHRKRESVPFLRVTISAVTTWWIEAS